MGYVLASGVPTSPVTGVAPVAGCPQMFGGDFRTGWNSGHTHENGLFTQAGPLLLRDSGDP